MQLFEFIVGLTEVTCLSQRLTISYHLLICCVLFSPPCQLFFRNCEMYISLQHKYCSYVFHCTTLQCSTAVMYCTTQLISHCLGVHSLQFDSGHVLGLLLAQPRGRSSQGNIISRLGRTIFFLFFFIS